MSVYFKLSLIVILLVSFNAEGQEKKTTVLSPDGNILATFQQENNRDNTGTMYYSISYKGIPVILPSELDIQLDNHLSEQAMALKVDKHRKWCENLKVTGTTIAAYDTLWEPPYGENKTIRDHYNALIVHLVKDDNPIYKMDIEIRAYNEGVALRYFFPENEKGTYYRVVAEHTGFTLPSNSKAWFTGWGQGRYELLPVNNWPQEAERPLTLQLENGLSICLAEAALTDYARTKFVLDSTKPNTIQTSMYTPADLISPVATPWRVIMVAEKPGQLAERSYLLQNLNAPAAIKDVSWIQPGKIMRVMELNTKSAKNGIDFAAQHHLQYILFDWKWYGPAFSFSSDATKVAIPDFDLPGIIRYAREKGIGVWLYVNLQGLVAQSDSLFRVYKSWGIKGVKFGFVQAGSHRWTTWIENEFKLAAENHVMVNVHDDWRPTGEQRTWPNLMTAEGIRGNEEMPDATHNTVLPFTRYVAGAADYTICYHDPRIKTTHAHQLALAAVYYSPIQTLYWYDKPGDYSKETELEFWDNIPTSWDESRVLQGAPGEYVVTVRKKGENWFLGAITNNEQREVKLDFSFLTGGKKYKAVFYTDDVTVPTNTHVKRTEQKITAATKTVIKLQPSGGVAVWIQSE